MRTPVTLGAANISGNYKREQHYKETDNRTGRAGDWKETQPLTTLSHWLQPYLKPALPVGFLNV